MPHTEEWKAAWKKPEVEHGKPTKWGWTVYYPENLYLGRYVDIGWGTFINARFGVRIEDDVEIGPLCAILSDSSIDDKLGPVVLRRGSQIGAHCTVMPSVSVGQKATVGAHSFVKDWIPDGAVAYGVPAKVRQGAGCSAGT